MRNWQKAISDSFQDGWVQAGRDMAWLFQVMTWRQAWEVCYHRAYSDYHGRERAGYLARLEGLS